MEWLTYPNFIELHEPSGTYWVGTQFGGMLNSSDGLNWSEVPFFEGKSCNCFDYYGEHMAVSEVSNIYNIYWSDNSGFSWYTGTATPLLTDMKFNSFGMLYGISLFAPESFYYLNLDVDVYYFKIAPGKQGSH